MNAMKQFRFAMLLLLASALFGLSGCEAPLCRVPNPLIKFDLPGTSGFSVTFDSIAGASAVNLKVYDAAGDQLFDFNAAPGQTQVVAAPMDGNTPRPLQLSYFYKNANGDTVAGDSMRIDDREDLGVIPDMDVIISVTGTCPNTNQAINPDTDGEWRIFSWANTDTFVVSMRQTNPQVVEKLCLVPVPGAGGSPGTLKVFKMTNQTCVTNPATSLMNDNRLVRVTVSNTSFDIKSYDSNTGLDPEIHVKVSSGNTLSVSSNHSQ